MLHFVRWKQIAIVLSVVLGIVLRDPQLLRQGDGGELAMVRSQGADQPRAGSARRRPPAALHGDGGGAQGLARHAARRCAQAPARRQDRRHGRRHLQQCRAGAPCQGRGRRCRPQGAARALPADRRPHSRLRRQRPRSAQGGGRRDRHHADRGRPAAPHHRRHQRGHRDGAPARRLHGHHGGADRPPGQRPHPGAGAGPAGHGPAQGADRQDGAPDLPRGAPHDLGRGGEEDATADGLQDLSGRRPGGGRPAAARDAGRARRRAQERAAGLRPADARADHRLHLQRRPARASSASSPRRTSAARSPSCSTTR